MSNSLAAFLGDESGATAIEYALMSSLIALVIIASLTAIGTQLGNELTKSAAASNSPAPPSQASRARAAKLAPPSLLGRAA